MNVTTTPAPARTDVAAGTPATRPSPRAIRNHALALSAGAALWSGVSFALGFNPDTEAGVKATDLSAFAFQIGVMSLVTLQLRTRATGTGRKAAAMLQVERMLLALAMAWSVLHALLPSAREETWLLVLDVFWPLSMLGMFVIGIKVALAGRWRGAARFWPLVAESWAVVSIPAFGILGGQGGSLVGASHLLVGYVTLGLVIAAKPQLVAER
jgi:hypothetical protein